MHCSIAKRNGRQSFTVNRCGFPSYQREHGDFCFESGLIERRIDHPPVEDAARIAGRFAFSTSCLSMHLFAAAVARRPDRPRRAQGAGPRGAPSMSVRPARPPACSSSASPRCAPFEAYVKRCDPDFRPNKPLRLASSAFRLDLAIGLERKHQAVVGKTPCPPNIFRIVTESKARSNHEWMWVTVHRAAGGREGVSTGMSALAGVIATDSPQPDCRRSELGLLKTNCEASFVHLGIHLGPQQKHGLGSIEDPNTLVLDDFIAGIGLLGIVHRIRPCPRQPPFAAPPRRVRRQIGLSAFGPLIILHSLAAAVGGGKQP